MKLFRSSAEEMSFAPNHGNQHPYNRSSKSGLSGPSTNTTTTAPTNPSNYGKVRTDFSGLFPPSTAAAAASAVSATGRVRTRNNSQTQKPVTLMFAGAAAAGGASSARGGSGQMRQDNAAVAWPSFELQFPVDEDQRDTLSCELGRRGQERPGAAGDSGAAAVWNQQGVTASAAVAPSMINHTGYLSATTRPSFDILNDASAEAYDFFAAAANSGIDFNHQVDYFVEGGTINNAAAATGGGVNGRQRHFSLEDYNDMAEESSNESFVVSRQPHREPHQNQLQTSTKLQFGDRGLLNNSSMQVDDEQELDISINGSEPASTPSTPSTAGLGLPNAFTFPVNTIESKINPMMHGRGFGNAVVPAAATLVADQAGIADSHHISTQLQNGLRHKLLAAIEEKCRKSLQFPCNLLQEIAAHVIQEASLEPCGLKGCLIFIYFEGENDCQYLNTLRCDPATIPTFELTLTLRQNQAKMRGWIPDIVKRNFSVMPNVMVSTSYRLVKRRKYRLNEIEELSLQ